MLTFGIYQKCISLQYSYQPHKYSNNKKQNIPGLYERLLCTKGLVNFDDLLAISLQSKCNILSEESVQYFALLQEFV